jgi:hypothetical protein
MTTFELEVFRRNARLRAWRSLLGLPLEGGWRAYYRTTGTPPHWRADLDVRCSACPDASHSSSRGESFLFLSAGSLAAGLVEAERDAWQEIAGEKVGSCPHLVPLLGPEPPEVAALAELEIFLPA